VQHNAWTKLRDDRPRYSIKPNAIISKNPAPETVRRVSDVTATLFYRQIDCAVDLQTIVSPVLDIPLDLLPCGDFFDLKVVVLAERQRSNQN